MCHLIRWFAFQRIEWLAFQDLKIKINNKTVLCKIGNVTHFLCLSEIVLLLQASCFSVCLQKCEGVLPVEFRSFAVDPQITSLEVLQHILIRAFELNGWVWTVKLQNIFIFVIILIQVYLKKKKKIDKPIFMIV